MPFVLEHPAVVTVALMGLMALVYFIKRLSGSREKSEKEAIPGLDALLVAGRYDEAARLAVQHEKLDDAIELYLRAQSPGRAAQVAARKGDNRLAGELYERAGDRERAAACYERAGMTAKARELDPSKSARDSADQGPGLVAERRSVPSARESDGANTESPIARFERLRREASPRDTGRMELQQAAVSAAESALASGELRRAADIYRDAGLFEEAVHLLVNVLGQPGDAAPLLAARGHRDRAAELYELAGQKTKAAETWAEVARASAKPEQYINRIAALDPSLAVQTLSRIIGKASPNRDTAELHYGYGEALEAVGERAKALEVFAALMKVMGPWRDLSAKVKSLGGGWRHDQSTLPEVQAPSPEPATRAASKLSPRPAAVHAVKTAAGTYGDTELVTDDIKAIAAEAARAAVDRLRRSSLPPPAGADGAVVTARLRGQAVVIPPTRVVAVTLAEPLMATPAIGLEVVPVAIELLHDAAVKAARESAGVDTLLGWVGAAPCALNNIEVYYRLGLAHLAAGSWAEAQKCFEAVEEASPGYRDAAQRAGEISKWRSALGARVTVRGGGEVNPGAPPRYRIKGELGRGGMAVVYRAEDQVLGRDVALKFLAESALGHSELREMFQREARAVAQLNHPNIVTIHDVGELDGRAFIAMEFIEGETLDAMLARTGKLPVVEALRVAMQALAALEAAHSRQIIHRDVKPSNLMRANSGLVKLMDFGLARSIAQGAKSSVVAGTPAYMPPEQFVGDHVDHRADLFALGASLYELITGELPFESMARVARPPSMKKYLAAVPSVVDDVVLMALDPLPEKRFASAAAMAAPLRRVLAAVDQLTGAVPELVRSSPPAAVVSSSSPPSRDTVDDSVSLASAVDSAAHSPEAETHETHEETVSQSEVSARAGSEEPTPARSGESAPSPPRADVSGADGFVDFNAPKRPSIAPVDPRDLMDDDDDDELELKV